MNPELLINQIEAQWITKLSSFIDSEQFDNIIEGIKQAKAKGKRIAPDSKDSFNAFLLCPYNELKVVIIGQDPYHNWINNKPVAEGLAFSSGAGLYCPPSLKNIIKEVERDIYQGFDIHVSSEYSLRRWAVQGILLLNTALTVEESIPGSHIKLWKPFTEYIFKVLNENNSGLIFMLWGNEAQKYEELINTNLH
jgi:uracil-DNA glycosylase